MTKRIKTVISVLPALALVAGIFSIAPLTAFADEAPLTVTAASNFFPSTVNTYYDLSEFEDDNGDAFITVEYKMHADQKYIINIDADLTYDPEVLEWSADYNKTGTVINFFPFAAENGFGAGIVNQAEENRVVGNYSSVRPAAWAYNEDGSAVTVVKAVFKVLDRNAGATAVNCFVEYMAMCDEAVQKPYVQYQVIADGVVDSELELGETLSTVVTPASQEPPVVILVGDVDNDGQVTISDATLLQQHFAEFTAEEGAPLLDLTDEAAFTRTDANRDGKIDIRDVTQIQRLVAEFVIA